MFFDFTIAFNTIRRTCLKLSPMQVDHNMVLWISDYLTNRSQFVQLHGSLSDMLMANTSASQVIDLSSFLFTICISDFRFNSATFHLQTFYEDYTIMGCTNEEKYRRVGETRWCRGNHL